MREIPVKTQVDVLVVGGGPSGFAAAVSSARAGAKTILVERYGFLGGTATAASVNPFMVSKVSGRYIIGGVFQEIIDELKKRNAAKEGELFSQPHIAFDPEVLKIVLFEIASKSGLKMLLHSYFCGSIMKENEVKGGVFINKKGESKILAKVTVDATGDGDVAYYSGVKCFKGRDKDGLMQPATLMFTIAGVDETKIPSREEINKMFRRAKNEGKINIPRENLLWFEGVRSGFLHFNSTRIQKVDGIDPDDLTKAELEGRRQVEEIFLFLKKNVPGFEYSYIVSTGFQVGIRETRRIKGEYTLTEEDILEGRKFDDVIAMASYPIDVHSPTGGDTVFKPIGVNNSYDIPYRCLIPKGVDGLIVVGRAISATSEAMSSIRVMPTCMAIGQAGGVAAAISCIDKVQPKNVNIEKLQRLLIEQGAIIDVR